MKKHYRFIITIWQKPIEDTFHVTIDIYDDSYEKAKTKVMRMIQEHTECMLTQGEEVKETVNE